MPDKNIIEQAKEVLGTRTEQAKDFIEDPKKLENLLQQLEEKLRSFPVLGERLSDIALLASLVRSYALNEYREVSQGAVLAAAGCLLYVIAPIDAIPDVVPGAGVVDDAALVIYVLKLIHDELTNYKNWRIENGKQQVATIEAVMTE